MPPSLPDIVGFWYLATAYSKYSGGIDAAFIAACRVAGRLIKHGIRVYSPIAHTHPIAIHSGMDPHDHSIWLPADEPFMRAAGGLIVCKMPGWEESYGISQEIRAFTEQRKPIFYLDVVE